MQSVKAALPMVCNAPGNLISRSEVAYATAKSPISGQAEMAVHGFSGKC